MKDIKFGSNDRFVNVEISTGDQKPRASLGNTYSQHDHSRSLLLSVKSDVSAVTLSLKPSVIAREARQERLNKTIRLGFSPVSKKTKV